MQRCGGDHPASLYQLAINVFALAPLWRAGKFISFPTVCYDPCAEELNKEAFHESKKPPSIASILETKR
jgi:hypothetical protein